MTQVRYQSWMREDPKPVLSKAIGTATVIAVGDLVQASSGTVIPASDHVWNTNLATTQEEFHDLFLGVAAERSRTGDIDSIRVNTSGVHLFDCASASFELGDLVGPAKQSGNLLENQKVVAVATANLAVGRAASRGTSLTSLEVSILSVVMMAGAQAPA